MPRPDYRAEPTGRDCAVVRNAAGLIVGAITLFGDHRGFNPLALEHLCALVTVAHEGLTPPAGGPT